MLPAGHAAHVLLPLPLLPLLLLMLLLLLLLLAAMHVAQAGSLLDGSPAL